MIKLALIQDKIATEAKIEAGEPIIDFINEGTHRQWINFHDDHHADFNLYKSIGTKPVRIGVLFRHLSTNKDTARVTVSYITP